MIRTDPNWTICGMNLCFLDLYEDKIRILNLEDIVDELLLAGQPEIL